MDGNFTLRFLAWDHSTSRGVSMYNLFIIHIVTALTVPRLVHNGFVGK